VVIKATHGCMTTRGVHKHGVTLVTSRMLGCFRDNPSTRQEFMTGLNILFACREKPATASAQP
jgi:GTP cyclohydrolase I